MEIFITRHGQTKWNALGKIQGQTDIELNDIGRGQAKETSELLKDEKIDLIITSPLKRAKETAEIINSKFNVEIIEDKRLMERGFGECEGMTKYERAKLKAVTPEVENIWNYNTNVNVYNMETMKDFCLRVYDFLDDLIKKYKDKNILLVTHGGVSVPIKFYFSRKCCLRQPRKTLTRYLHPKYCKIPLGCYSFHSWWRLASGLQGSSPP